MIKTFKNMNLLVTSLSITSTTNSLDCDQIVKPDLAPTNVLYMYCSSLYGCYLSAIQTFCLLTFASHWTNFTIPLIVCTFLQQKDYGPGETQLSISNLVLT